MVSTVRKAIFYDVLISSWIPGLYVCLKLLNNRVNSLSLRKKKMRKRIKWKYFYRLNTKRPANHKELKGDSNWNQGIPASLQQVQSFCSETDFTTNLPPKTNELIIHGTN